MHFGAVIEALRKVCTKRYSGQIPTKIVDDPRCLGGLKAVMESILDRMGLRIGDAAWRRRNDAAHGRAIPTGSELEAIQDTKFLRGLFDRMRLKLVDASDGYILAAFPYPPPRRPADDII